MTYLVTGPLVLIKDTAGRITYVYEGHMLPEWTGDDTISQLLNEKLIAAIEPQRGQTVGDDGPHEGMV
jgi:hypothetical protein